jgi:hypothetical protein
MSIYEAFKTAAQMSISSTNMTLVILDGYYYSSAIGSSLPLMGER